MYIYIAKVYRNVTENTVIMGFLFFNEFTKNGKYYSKIWIYYKSIALLIEMKCHVTKQTGLNRQKRTNICQYCKGTVKLFMKMGMGLGMFFKLCKLEVKCKA